MEDEGEVTDNPMRRMKPPAVPGKPVGVLTEEHLRRLLAVCAGRDFKARRDTALIMLLLDSGGRLTEISETVRPFLAELLDAEVRAGWPAARSDESMRRAAPAAPREARLTRAEPGLARDGEDPRSRPRARGPRRLPLPCIRDGDDPELAPTLQQQVEDAERTLPVLA